MTLDEIKQAVEEGKTVHWASRAYKVVKDDVTVNGQPEDFFLG